MATGNSVVWRNPRRIREHRLEFPSHRPVGLKVDSVEREVRRFYVEDAGVRAGDRIVVAVSGGPDSSALLHLTYDLRHELAFDLHVAHFDHRLRDQSADDAEFVRKTALELGVPVVIEAAKVNEIARRRGTGMEDAARRARYDFLERTRSRLGGRFVAIAHNLEDQAETLLLRLFRGAGTAGAAAMRPVSGALVRPILGVSRKAILEYCAWRGAAYRTDHTNAEAIADRNRLRLNVMPELRRVWPGIDSVLARNAQLFAEDASALEWAAGTALESVRIASSEGQIEVSRPALRNLPPHVLRLVLRRAAMRAGRTQPPNKARLDAVMDFCLSPRGGGRMSMGGGVEVLRGYDTALFKSERHEPARILERRADRAAGRRERSRIEEGGEVPHHRRPPRSPDSERIIPHPGPRHGVPRLRDCGRAVVR